MTARATLRDLLALDTEMQTMVSPDGWYAFGAPDTPPERPFVVMKWGETEPGLGVIVPGSARVALWVYDEPADFARIDAVIDRAKRILDAAEHVIGLDGTITQADWVGDSEDFKDDVYECLVRTSVYRVGVRV